MPKLSLVVIIGPKNIFTKFVVLVPHELISDWGQLDMGVCVCVCVCGGGGCWEKRRTVRGQLLCLSAWVSTSAS